MKELESLNAAFVIDTFLLLLIGIGPKIALVPFLETTRQMPEATQRRVLRKMLTTAATVAVLLRDHPAHHRGHHGPRSARRERP